MLPSSCRDSVVVISPAKTDKRGTLVDDWSRARRETVNGCSFQYSTSNSDRDARDNTQTTAILYAPPTANIHKGDRIEHHGIVFEIDGMPMLMEGLSRRLSHYRINLIEWEG